MQQSFSTVAPRCGHIILPFFSVTDHFRPWFYVLILFCLQYNESNNDSHIRFIDAYIRPVNGSKAFKLKVSTNDMLGIDINQTSCQDSGATRG